MKPIKKYFFYSTLLILVFCNNLDAQQNEYENYNRKRVGPHMRYWHEGLATTALTIDLDREDAEEGNLSQGVYYGVGLGFSTLLGFDNISQRVGLGFRAEYYPDYFAKFNIIGDLKILVLTPMLDFILGDKIYENHTYFSLFSGVELNMTYDLNTQRKEFHDILYLLEFQYTNLEFKWGLQSWNDWFRDGPYFDYAFHVFKFTYKFRKE